MRVTRILLALSLAIAAAIGCEDSDTSDSPSSSGAATATANAFNTPEAVFEAFSKASGEGDWKSAITMVTPESQGMAVVGMVMESSFMTMDDEAKGNDLKALFKRHGLDDGLAGEEAPMEDLEGVTELVNDLPAFVGELSDWITKNGSGKTHGFPHLTDLTNVEIDGDKATGMAKSASREGPVGFEKTDGNWKVDLTMKLPPKN